jgi:hypothetical protein
MFHCTFLVLGDENTGSRKRGDKFEKQKKAAGLLRPLSCLVNCQPVLAARATWTAAAATTAFAITARRTLGAEGFFRLAFGAWNFLACRLVDDLHRQT